MKPKKVLSFLLAVMMLVSMIPTSVLAAEETLAMTPTADAKNLFDVQLSVSKTFGATYTKQGGPNSVAASLEINTPRAYNDTLGGTNFGRGDYNYKNIDANAYTVSAENLVKNIELADKVFTAGTSEITVAPEEPFYLGTKVKSSPRDTGYYGISTVYYLIAYDDRLVEPAGELSYVDNSSGSPVTKPADVAVNLALTGKFNQGPTADYDGFNDVISYLSTNTTTLNLAGSSMEMSDKENATNHLKYIFVNYNIDTSSRYPLLESNTWDFVFPFKAKTGQGGKTAKFYVVKQADTLAPGAASAQTTSSVMEITNVKPNGTAAIGQGSTFAAFQISPTGNSDHYKTNVVSVKIESNDPTLEPEAAVSMPLNTATDVALALEKDTFKSQTDAENTSNWTVTGATLNSVKYVDSTHVTLNLTASAAGAISVTAKGAALTKGADVAVTTEITAVAPPEEGDGKDYKKENDDTSGAGGLKITNNASKTIKYKLGTDNWTEIAASNNKVFTEADLYAAAEAVATAEDKTAAAAKTYDDLIKVSFGSESIYSGIDVTQAAAPVVEAGTANDNAKVVVDYAGEKIYFGTNTSYAKAAKTKAALTGTAGTGSATSLTTDLNTDGVTYNVWTTGTTGTIRSFPKAVALSRPAAPNVAVDNTNKAAAAKKGLTALTGLKVGQEYITVTTGATPDWSTATPTDVTADDVTAGALAVKSGNDIYVRTKASTTANSEAFASAPTAKLEASGNAYGTVTVAGVTKGSTSITLTLEGDEWAASNPGSHVTVNKDSSPISVTWGTPSNGVMTGTVTALEAGEYTVEITADAVQGTTAPKFWINNAENATCEITITNEGFKFGTITTTAIDSLTPTLTTDKNSKVWAPGVDGETVTVSGIPDGYELKTVTATKGTASDASGNTFTYAPPANKEGKDEDQPIQDNLTITLQRKNLTALKYADAEFGFGDTSIGTTGIPATKDDSVTDLEIKTAVDGDNNDVKAKFSIDASGKITATASDLSSNTDYTITVGSQSISWYTTTFTLHIGKEAAIATVADKNYDGETTTGKITFAPASDPTATLKITVTGAVFADAEVGDNKDVDFTNANWDGDDYNKYTVTTTGVKGNIKAKTVGATDIVAAPANKITLPSNKSTDIDALVAEIIKLPITVDGVEGNLGTIKEAFADEDAAKAAVKTAIEGMSADTEWKEAIITGAEQVAANKVELPAGTAVETAVNVDQYIGGTVTLTGTEGATVAFKSSTPANLTLNAATADAPATITVGAGATADTAITGTLEITPADGGDKFEVAISITPKTAPTTNKYDFTKVTADAKLTLTATAGKVTTNLAGNATINVSTPVTVASAPVIGGGGSNYGYTVTFDNAGGLGTAETTYVQTDENGKISALPKVTDVAKGAQFLGWSTNGTVAGIIDPNYFTVNNDSTVLYAVYTGYMAGYEDHTAQPDKNITRAELVKMLVVAAGIYDRNTNYGPSSFSDVKSGWYVNYVACAEKAGIANGKGDGSFGPNEGVTRQDAAILIARTFNVSTTEGATTDKFTDAADVSRYAMKYITALTDNGTITGYAVGDGFEFRPLKNVTRAEAARMINKYLITDANLKNIKADPGVKNSFTDMTNKNAWHYADIMFASLSAPADYYSADFTDLANK